MWRAPSASPADNLYCERECEMGFTCRVCDQEFPTRADLMRHKKTCAEEIDAAKAEAQRKMYNEKWRGGEVLIPIDVPGVEPEVALQKDGDMLAFTLLATKRGNFLEVNELVSARRKWR